ncbi:type II secretion system protein [Angustibacter luteus]|uniref:Type II secretion system protein n=1 Tax=Angustibacter luteus TaxID=658456 RepID=A0ABW1J990_9ACTN
MLARIRKAAEEKDSGFTLIELLVVMIIIGILAAIAIPVFLNQRKKAVDTSMKSDLRTVANEMETYYTDNQNYPADASGTDAVLVGTGNSIKLTKGNKITVTTTVGTGILAGTFCLKAENAKGTGDWYYDSDQGGLQPKGTAACS